MADNNMIEYKYYIFFIIIMLLTICMCTYEIDSKKKSTYEIDSKKKNTHVFGLGIFKSGTTSLANWFYKCNWYHEPEKQIIFDLIKENNQEKIKSYVLDKDKRLALDIDVSGYNMFILTYLIDLFPDAKFILIKRNLEDNFNSIIAAINSNDRRAEIAKFFFGKPNVNIPKQEINMLKIYPMYWPIELIVSKMYTMNENVLKLVPKDRLLILNIDDGPKNISKISKFIDIPKELLRYCYKNKTEDYIKVTSLIDQTYVKNIFDKYKSN
jgi:hypothetical protein